MSDKTIGRRNQSKAEKNRVLEKDTKEIKQNFQGTFSCLDFSYICSLFLVANIKLILHNDNIQKQKLRKL